LPAKIMSTVTLAEAPEIPKAYRDTIISFLAAYYGGRAWEMRESFGLYQLPPLLTNDQLLHTMLAQQLAEIARAAAGEIPHSEEAAEIIYQNIQDLMEALFAPRGVGTGYQIPASFWDSPLGQMVSRAILWIKGDELISLAEAAKIRGVSIPAISQAVKAGRLTRYVDPNASQRQGRTLVSRAEVECAEPEE